VTTIRTLPAHEVVRRTFPRAEPTESELVAMAIGKVTDTTLSQVGHQIRMGRRPTAGGVQSMAASLLRDTLEEAAVAVPSAESERIVAQVVRVVQAYRKSVIAGLPRPKTRVIVIGESVGIYAQPDYWDGRARFFEMKSYPAKPTAPEVALQLRIFQLAFPTLEAVLVCLNRHTDPVETTSVAVPPPTAEEANAVLRTAFRLATEFGQAKVLEYVEGPFVRYPLPPEPAASTHSQAPEARGASSGVTHPGEHPR
jgi:hypothetical protein